MELSFLALIIEISLCFFITLGLLLYYARKNINKVVFLTALIIWFLNFVLVIILPFDIYYTQTSTGINNGIPENTKKLIQYGYTIIYWSLFIFSWIFIPLMQCYESSGEFTKLEKLKSSLKENLIYYGVLAVIGIVILIIAIIKLGYNETLPLAKDCSLIFGILLFFFLLSYSLIKYPKTLFFKLHLKKKRKENERIEINEREEKKGKLRMEKEKAERERQEKIKREKKERERDRKEREIKEKERLENERIEKEKREKEMQKKI